MAAATMEPGICWKEPAPFQRNMVCGKCWQRSYPLSAEFPGDYLPPSLSAGAGIGHAAANLVTQADAGALVVIGMAAYFSGVVRVRLLSS